MIINVVETVKQLFQDSLMNRDLQKNSTYLKSFECLYCSKITIPKLRNSTVHYFGQILLLYNIHM